MDKNLKKIIFTFFKIIIILLSFFYIFQKLKNFDFSYNFTITTTSLSIFIFVIILMLINWILESYKWILLTTDIEKISINTAIKSVLIGLVFGLFTPNRIGEIGGKTIYLKTGNKTRGIFVASYGSIVQFTITILFGLIGFILFVLLSKTNLIKTDIAKIIIYFSIITLFILLLLIFNIRYLIYFAIKIKLPLSFVKKLLILKKINKIIAFKTLIYSGLRYTVFVIQFYLLLIIFDAEITILHAVIGISTVYLFMNILPSIVIADLGIRGSVSIFILGQFSENTQGILTASVVLWIINIMLPSILGLFLYINRKNSICIY